jgi:DNA-binding protein YbaB
MPGLQFKKEQNMFGQMKDLYNMQKQAREMKKQLEAEQITGSSKDGAIQLTINGSYDLLSVKVNQDSQLSPSQIEAGIRQAYEDANSQLKAALMEKFKGMM